jgi:hypothetical protein
VLAAPGGAAQDPAQNPTQTQAQSATQNAAQDPAQAPETPGDQVLRIEEHTREMANNTKPILVWRGKSYDSWVLLAASLISLVVGIISTCYSVKTSRRTLLTARNVKEQTRQQEINKPAQDAILRGLIEHLYRNKVVACAVRWRLSDLGYDKCYPSEEILLKMKILPEDLRLDRFDSSPDHYGKLHTLGMLFRNYTIDVDVALGHLKTRPVSQEVKEGDLLGLEYRSQLLTEKIRDLMDCTGLELSDDDIRDMLLKKREDHFRRRKTEVVDPDKAPDRTGDEAQYYDKIGLSQQLDRDICHEYSRIDTIDFVV